MQILALVFILGWCNIPTDPIETGFYIEASDPDNDSLTYSLIWQKPNKGIWGVTPDGQIFIEDGKVKRLKKKTYRLRVQVIDQDSLWDRATMYVKVEKNKNSGLNLRYKDHVVSLDSLKKAGTVILLRKVTKEEFYR